MKMLFHFFKMFWTCILFIYIIPSCNTSTTSQEKAAEDSVATETFLTGAILIVDSDEATGELILKDVGEQHSRSVNRAAPSEVVNWQVKSNSGVESIDSIAIDASVNNNYEVFDVLPHKMSSTHWQGKIKASFPRNAIYVEKYFIKWTDKKTPPRTHTYDPFIQVNPSKLGPGIDTSRTEK
ncbi:MAG: hypothetical protein ABIO76_13435 [Ginsengibacter sp.]